MANMWQTVAGAAAGAVLIIILYLAKNALTTSAWHQTGAGLTLIVRAKDTSELERTVRGLMILRRERVLRTKIVIDTSDRDKEFIRMAGILAGEFEDISVC